MTLCQHCGDHALYTAPTGAVLCGWCGRVQDATGFEWAFRVTGIGYDETLHVTAPSLDDAERQARDLFGAGYSRTLLGFRDLAPQAALAF